MKRQDLILAFIVVELHRNLQRGRMVGPFTVAEVKSLSPFDPETEQPTITLTDDEVRVALLQCETKNLLVAYRSQHWKTRYVATQDAINFFVAEQSASSSTPVHLYSVLGLYWLAEVLSNLQNGVSAEPLPAIENSHDEWEPLPIDRETPAYDEAMAALQKAYDAYRADNGYAATFPSERNSVVAALQVGIDWLKSKGEISLHVLKSLVIEPLRRGIQRFKDAVPGALAKTAIELLTKALGL